MNNNRGIVRKIWDFLKVRKKWWLLPPVVMIILLLLLMFFGHSDTEVPYYYAIF